MNSQMMNQVSTGAVTQTHPMTMIHQPPEKQGSFQFYASGIKKFGSDEKKVKGRARSNSDQSNYESPEKV